MYSDYHYDLARQRILDLHAEAARQRLAATAARARRANRASCSAGGDVHAHHDQEVMTADANLRASHGRGVGRSGQERHHDHRSEDQGVRS